MNINALSKILQVPTLSLSERKLLSKILILNVVDTHTLSSQKKEFTFSQPHNLKTSKSYWGVIKYKNDKVTLTKNISIPSLIQNLKYSKNLFNLHEIQKVFTSKEAQSTLKNHFLEQLQNSSSRDEFSANFNFLLSLEQNVISVPIKFYENFSLLQFKKRYNKKTKKTSIDFYAALELLGPISGVITSDNTHLQVNLNVAFKQTQTFLQKHIDEISLDVTISLVEEIQPLYEFKTNSLLDINI